MWKTCRKHMNLKLVGNKIKELKASEKAQIRQIYLSLRLMKIHENQKKSS